MFSLRSRAGDGNRTHAACLEGRGSTTELHPHEIQTRPVLRRAPGHAREYLGPGMCELWSAMLFSAEFSRQVRTRISGSVIPSMLGESTWVEQDSNLRRQCHQIYSLAPLAAWVSTRLGLCRRIGRPHQVEAGPCGDRRLSSRDRAGGETRTHNLRFTKPLLCQLSYASNQGREITYYIVWLNECKRLPGPTEAHADRSDKV